MNFKQLAHFIALAEHRSFVRASEACNITQPAFSRSIRGLEEALGCQLIDRHSGRNFQPTVQGDRVLQHARTVLEGMVRLISEVSQNTELEIGEVRIGCGPVPAASLVPKAIATFISRHPRMQVRLDVENWEKLVPSLRREDLDFLVTASEPFINDENYDVFLLKPQRMAMFCRAGHPLLSCSTVTPQELFRFPVGIAGGSRRALFNVARINNVSAPSVAMECDNIQALLSVISSSNMIGLLHANSSEGAGASENVVRINQLTGLSNNYARYAIIQRRGQRLSAAAARMLQTIKETDVQPALANNALLFAT